ncbi:MAG: DUF2508 family protein [Syntrophomonadaceae bacterium]|nr:DUF2508 family protein [Syntrophomonadaceae bacterium]
MRLKEYAQRLTDLITTKFCCWKKEILSQVFRDRKTYDSNSDREECLRLIWEAHQDWVQAYNLLNSIVESERVEYAIQFLNAAENRYQYLLKWARLNQVTAFDPNSLRGVETDASVC